MKMVFSMLLSVVIIAAVYGYFMKGGDILGVLGQKQSAPVKKMGSMTNVVTDKQVTVYQWVDEQGVTQFSSTPPVGHVKVETLNLKPDTNVMKATAVPEEEEKPASGPVVTSLGDSTVYSPDGVKELMQNTKDVQDMMNQRMSEQQEFLDQLSGKNKK